VLKANKILIAIDLRFLFREPTGTLGPDPAAIECFDHDNTIYGISERGVTHKERETKRTTGTTEMIIT
jgi:hypothetical protein